LRALYLYVTLPAHGIEADYEVRRRVREAEAAARRRELEREAAARRRSRGLVALVSRLRSRLPASRPSRLGLAVRVLGGGEIGSPFAASEDRADRA
jgi:hypothetical protein